MQEIAQSDPSQSASPQPSWELQLLGGLSCRHGNLLVEKFATRKAALLLIRLGLTAGIAVQRDELATVLWPDEPVDVSRPRLRQAVISLKRSFPEDVSFPLSALKNEAKLEGADVRVDCLEFERLARSGQDAEAIAIYRPLLPGWVDPWIAPYRKKYEALFERAALRLADASSPEHALRLLAEVCAVHPLNEVLLAAYMSRLNLSGEQARSRQVFEHYAAMLDAQMGLSPGTAIRELAAEATASHARAEPIAIRIEAGPLPRPLTRMFGRHATIGRLTALIEGGRRLVTLTGIGGIGKTRIALEFAHRQEFFETVAFVPFVPVSDNALVFEAIQSALGIPAGFRSDTAATLIKALSGRKILLILDSVEHLLPGIAKSISSLLSGCPGLVVLATSRVPFGIAGEQVMSVGPLSDIEEAAAMFLDRAALLSDTSDSDAETVAAAKRIAHDLDGIPLAIELAAAQSGLLSLGEIESRLKDRLSFLKGGSDVVEPRHARLDEVLAWSIESLPEESRGLFAMLSVFHGTFTVASASAVYGEPAEKQVELLRKRSLIVDVPSSGNRRFRMLQTVRESASRQLDPHRAREYRKELRKYLIEFGNAQSKLFQSAATSAKAHDALAEELENVRDCMATAVDEDLEAGLELAIKHAIIGASQGSLADARYWLETYILKHSWPNELLVARGFFQLAIAVGYLGEEELELQYLQRCEAIAKECGEAEVAALAGANLAINLLWWSRLNDARQEAETCLPLAAPHWTLKVMLDLIIVRARGLLGELEWAQERMREILDAVRKQDANAWILSESWFGVAHLALEAGDFDGALSATHSGIAVLQAGGYSAGASNVLTFLARVLVASGRTEEAWSVVGQLRELDRDRGIPDGSIYGDFFAGILSSDANLLVQAAKRGMELTQWSLAAAAFHALADIEPDPATARRYLSAARTMRDEHGVDLSAAETRHWNDSVRKIGLSEEPPGSIEDLLKRRK